MKQVVISGLLLCIAVVIYITQGVTVASDMSKGKNSEVIGYDINHNANNMYTVLQPSANVIIYNDKTSWDTNMTNDLTTDLTADYLICTSVSCTGTVGLYSLFPFLLLTG